MSVYNQSLKCNAKSQLLCRLNCHHKSIGRVKDSNLEGNKVTIISEFVEGENLLDFVESLYQNQEYSEELAKTIVAQLIDALSHLHSQQLILGMLEPQNIVI